MIFNCFKLKVATRQAAVASDGIQSGAELSFSMFVKLFVVLFALLLWLQPRSQMARQELLCDSLALDALHIVFLHPGYRYSYFAQVSGGGRIKLTLRRQLRELNACTSG